MDGLNSTNDFMPYINITDNITWLYNASQKINSDLLKQYMLNRKVDEPAFEILIALYSLLIVVGAAGNSLVVMSVARKPAMRTARNIFIVNLAVSDLLLCVVTMPLTLLEILTKYWPLGQQNVVCKMIGTLQATSIYVSTISITAIALDRYQVIVYPTRESLQLMGAGIILSLIWLSALILASPMYLYRMLNHHPLNLSMLGIDGISFCVEEWPVEHGRAYYSIFTLVVQYVLPIITVSVGEFLKSVPTQAPAATIESFNLNGLTMLDWTNTVSVTMSEPSFNNHYMKLTQLDERCVNGQIRLVCHLRYAGGTILRTFSKEPTTTVMAYLRIYYKLRYRYATGYVGNENQSSNRRALRGRRLQRTNLLLVSIAVIFGISWLPLNLFNLLADLWKLPVTQNMIVSYAICHMIGMSSACSNPLLYGWLNDNFRKEFYDLLCNKEMDRNGETQKLSTIRGSTKDGSKKRLEAVTMATDCLHGNTVDTEMTVVSK